MQLAIKAPHPSCRHGLPASRLARDASGDIHVNLGSGTPCRNDGTEANAKHRKTVSRDLARYDKHVGFSFRIAAQYQSSTFGFSFQVY
jgi:hypothetical protein